MFFNDVACHEKCKNINGKKNGSQQCCAFMEKAYFIALYVTLLLCDDFVGE